MIGWAIEALVASALLMALVLAVRGPVRRAFGPGVAYALWALPALRLLLPPLPAEWRGAVAAPIAAAGERITVLFVSDAAPVAAASPWPSPGAVLAGAWLVGAAGFLVWHMVAHARFCRRLLGAAVVTRELAAGHVRVVASAACAGPLAFGLWRRTVAVPSDFAERYDPEERALAIAHELGHHLRGDLFANWIALIVLALHWFNPLAWASFRAFRADQEMANDAAVLAGRPSALRHAYGRAIVKSAHGGAVSAACHLHTVHELKGRLKMLNETAKSRRRIAAGGTAIAAVALIALAATASGSRAAERIRTRVGETLHVTIPPVAPVAALQAAPPAPAAPAGPVAPAEPVAPVASNGGRAVTSTTVATPDGRTAKRVIVVRTDGKGDPAIDARIDGEAARLGTASPEALAAACGEKGDTESFVLNESDGKKRKIVFCHRNTLTGAPVSGTAVIDTDRIERDAIRQALDGVRSARGAVLANRDMPAEKRRQALAGIDKAIAELESQAAKD